MELLGETRIIRIILLIMMVRAGAPFVGDSFGFDWKPKCIDHKNQYILDSSLSGGDYWREGCRRGLLLVLLLVLLYVSHLKALF